jgi:hypothetical protein
VSVDSQEGAWTEVRIVFPRNRFGNERAGVEIAPAAKVTKA